MNPTILALSALILGLSGGIALGWFLGSRPVAEWRARHAERDGEARELDEKFRRAIAELGDSRIELATLKANEANFDKQQRLLLEAQEALRKEFEAAGAKVLEGAQEAFLKRASDRFAESENTNAERIRTLLEPVGQRLKSYEEQVGKLEKERVDAFGNLAGLIEGMRVGQEQIRAEAQRLGNSLTNAPKARGRWANAHCRMCSSNAG